VKRVVVTDLRGGTGGAPGRIQPADEVSPVERVVLVDLFARLLLLGDARIEEPPVRLAFQSEAGGPIDVHGREESKSPLLVQDHAEVVVGQDVTRLARRQSIDRGGGDEIFR